jgi:hypothetical protein
MTNLQSASYLGFEIDLETGRLDANCGCSQCNHTVQRGHFLCSTSPDKLLEDEDVRRSFKEGKWGFYAPSWAYQ